MSTICLDFDGVVHSYVSGWKGETCIPDPPVPLTKKVIEVLRSDYEVVIFSTRCKTKEGLEAIKRWLDKYNIVVDKVTDYKPPAIVYVDDRAIKFEGDWIQTLEDITNFKHYIRKSE